LPTHSALAEEVDKLVGRGGYLYPPLDETPAGSGLGRSQPVYQQWASHVIELDTSSEDLGRARASFVVQLLAFLHGTRLQLADRWMEGRIPLRGSNDFEVPLPRVAGVVGKALQVWESLGEKDRTVLTNLLYLHSKAPAYEWDWETFALEYWVTDGLYRHAVDCHKMAKAKTHGARVAALCGRFGLGLDEKTVARIASLRNALMHEALWDGQLPGSQASDQSYLDAKLLRGLNSRVICAILGCQNKYVSSDWTLWEAFPFD
jgi:hypothetical protein